MSGRIANTGFMPDIIVSSTAKRAHETARLFAQGIGYDEHGIQVNPDLYLCDTSEVVETIRNLPDDVGNAMIFFHNPTITSMAYDLGLTWVANVRTSCCVSFTYEKAWSDFSVDQASNVMLLDR